MLRIIKEWHGLNNSAIYLQQWEHEPGKKTLTILYGYSMINGNRFESGESFNINDLYDENSKLIKLLLEDFDEGTLNELRVIGQKGVN